MQMGDLVSLSDLSDDVPSMCEYTSPPLLYIDEIPHLSENDHNTHGERSKIFLCEWFLYLDDYMMVTPQPLLEKIHEMEENFPHRKDGSGDELGSVLQF